MVTTIIFDLSEVLLRGLLGIEEYINVKYAMKIENSHWRIQELEKLFHGEISEDTYWQAVLHHHGWNLTVAQLKAAVRKNFREIEGTREIITSLKQNGYRLGLLSVHAKEWIEHCEETYGYHELFDSVMYSFEVSVSKPDKKAYQLILEKLNVSAKECLFIDDTIQNIEAAKKIGMEGIQFESSDQLKAALQTLKIKI